MDLGIGTDDYYRATLDANLRLSDFAAVRGNLLYAYEEVPNRNFSDRERWGAALSAAFLPTDTVRILVDYYHLTADDMPDLGGYVPRPTGSGPDDVTVYSPWDDVPNYAQEEDFLESDVDTVTARIFWETAPGVTLMNATRYGETQNGYVLTGLRGGAYDPATDTFAPLTLSTHQGYQEVDYFVNQFNLLADLFTGDLFHQIILGAEYSDYGVANGVYQADHQRHALIASRRASLRPEPKFLHHRREPRRRSGSTPTRSTICFSRNVVRGRHRQRLERGDLVALPDGYRGCERMADAQWRRAGGFVRLPQRGGHHRPRAVRL